MMRFFILILLVNSSDFVMLGAAKHLELEILRSPHATSE